MELMRSWRLERDVRAGAIAVQPSLAISPTLAAPRIALMPFGYPSDDEAHAVSPSAPCCCAQDHLEPLLVRQLRALGGTIRFGTQATEIDAADRIVRVRLVDAAGHSETVAAHYLVGADGPRSGVRDALGIGVDHHGSLGNFVAITFRAPLTTRLPQPPGALNAVDVDGAQGLFVPTSSDDRWVFACEWHPERGERIEDWTPQRCLELLRAASGFPDLAPQLLTVMPFEMAGHTAQTLRSGRAFLVGDAAHRTTPVGGTGMNTAIHAGHNLGWKLAWVRRGWAHPALLDSYDDERRPIGARAVLRSLDRTPPPAGAGLAADLFASYGPDGIAPDSAQVGQRAPHVWLQRRGRRVSTLDWFGAELVLVADRRAPGWRSAVTALAGSGLPIRFRSLGHRNDGAARHRYGVGDGSAVLIRPDGYVAARLPASDDPGPVVRSAVAAALGWSADDPAHRASAARASATV
jgi:2-polyprenyl-6-methoxyphenol hydroxylase-like FAD-dependent oxidoreductase